MLLSLITYQVVLQQCIARDDMTHIRAVKRLANPFIKKKLSKSSSNRI